MKKYLLFTLLFLPGYWLTAQDLPDDLQIGRHTVAEWKYIVDTTWGDGMPTEDKLILFDRFWEAVDLHYAGFVNNPVNWDSIKSLYRPEIEAGVSKGRFAGIINKMGLLLHEGHSGAYNREVYLTKPGRDIPVLIPGHYFYSEDTIVLFDHGLFGATLTPLNENELLVLRSVKNHPLGLEAGDIVLGYDGKPWKDLYPLLLQMDFTYSTNARFPDGDGIFHFDATGSSLKSAKHKWLAAAGMNWHFFDTLDFRKYGSMDTLHVPTSLLEGQNLHIAGNEQLPLKDIEFPGSVIYNEYAQYLPPVIFNTILDHSIGYVYYFHMMSADYVSKLKEALSSLAESDVQGIILDLRYNIGGSWGFERGFDPIFNRTIDSSGYYARATDGDHLDLIKFQPAFSSLSKDFLNKPIALITGPGAFSMGDYASYFIHNQPMTRSFGKGSNTGYVLHDNNINTLESNSPLNLYWDFGYPEWEIHFEGQTFGRLENGEINFLLHKGFELDEEIWFTQEAAYQQRDNMVERAVAWIKSVAYADACSVLNTYIAPGPEADPFVIKTGIVNPESHSFELDAKVYERNGTFIEQINMEGNTDGAMPGVNTEEWFGTFSPEPNRFYYAEISTHDTDEDSWLTYPGQLGFTTINKPEIFPKTLYLPAGRTTRFDLSFTNTSEIPLEYLQLKFSCNDPGLEIKIPLLNLGQILDKDQSTQKSMAIKIDETVEDSSEIWIQVDIFESSEQYWSDSILLVAMPVGEEDFQFRTELNIYPNPMSEFCRIQISGSILLEKIELYDQSGRLVFSENKIGASSFEIPKGNLANGIYILKVHADKLYERKLVVQ